MTKFILSPSDVLCRAGSGFYCLLIVASLSVSLLIEMASGHQFLTLLPR